VTLNAIPHMLTTSSVNLRLMYIFSMLLVVTGFQDWYSRPTTVLFGLGTGITPTLSVVRDFVFRLETRDWNMVAEKIYVVRSHRCSIKIFSPAK